MARTICITGVTSGVGLETARRFAREGWQVIGTGRRKERLDKLAAELGDCFLPLNFDVQSREAVEKAFSNLPAKFADIDVLLNNAGLSVGSDPAQSSDLDDWDAMVDTNIKGLLYCTRAILPGMVERNKGHVVNIGSVAGSRAFRCGNVYSASKAFVNHFNRNLKVDLLGTNIRVTSIEPGMLRTEFMDIRYKGDTSVADNFYAGADPLTPQDIAEAIWWSVNLPAHMNVLKMEIMPVCQSDGGWAFYRKN